MNAIDFLSGKFDPEYKKAQHLARIAQAKINKPKTVSVKVASDWGIDDKAHGGKPKPVRKREKRIYAIDGCPSVMQTGAGKYQVQIKHWNKNFYLGVFDTIEQATHARDTAKAELIAGTYIYKGVLAVDERPKKKKDSMLPKYIYWSKDKNKYLIQRTLGGKKLSHGTYKTLEEAVERLKELGWV